MMVGRKLLNIPFCIVFPGNFPDLTLVKELYYLIEQWLSAKICTFTHGSFFVSKPKGNHTGLAFTSWPGIFLKSFTGQQ